jgi:DNA-binding response OmpR family regulator
MRILVVEDERTLAGFVEQALEAEGYAVTLAHDGETAEAEALTGDYGLVLLDVMLPGRSGLEVLDSVRARKPEVPVILMTARGAIEQRVEGLDRGANDYVTKPFSFEELLARVRAHLRSSTQHAARGAVLEGATSGSTCARAASSATAARYG